LRLPFNIFTTERAVSERESFTVESCNPLSGTKHPILIDDMDRGKLERLIQDGYQPAAILESSLGHKRTARYAFGADGDRQAADLGKYRQQWERLEGREQPQQQRKNEREGPSLER
jgi:hypothetical protein